MAGGRPKRFTEIDRDNFSKAFRGAAADGLEKVLANEDHKNWWDAILFVLKRTEVPELRAMQIDMNAHLEGGLNVRVSSTDGKTEIDAQEKMLNGEE